MTLKTIKLTLIAVVITFIAFNCSVDPISTSDGDLIYKDNPINVLTLDVEVDTMQTLLVERNRGFTSTLVIGNSDYSSATTLLKFKQFWAVVEDRTLISASLVMSPLKVMGTSTSDVKVSIREVTESWNEDYYPDSGIEDIVVAEGYISQSIDDNDYLDIPLELVEKWYAAFLDSTLANNGIALSIEDENFSKVYHAKGNLIDGIEPYLSLTYLDAEGDTSYAEAFAYHDSYILENKSELEDEFFVTNYGAHSMLMKFNLPDTLFLSTIIKAEMSLTLDMEKSQFASDSIISFVSTFIMESDWSQLGNSESLSPAGEVLTHLGLSNIITINLTEMVSHWTSYGAINNGVAFRSNGVLKDLSYYVFKDASIDPKYKPKLKITYSTFDK